MKRKALLVGINRYRDPGNDLRGCVNDVRQVRRLLCGGFGFADGDVRVLTDAFATKEAILAGLEGLVAGAAAGDCLVFHYSGHGSRVPDRNGDETADRLDEILCPHDMDWDDPLTDDLLAEAFRTLPAGVALTAILDCCHSGTALRGERHHSPGPRAARFLPPPRGGEGRDVGRPFGVSVCRSQGVLLAACRDDQVSADARIDGDYHGAHTFFLCRSIEAARCAITFRDSVANTARALRAGGFPQEPQLEGSRRAIAGQVFGIPPSGGVGEPSAA